MASYEQVVKLENEKPDGVIRLVESNGFYRAYNKSAFLFHKVIAQHKVTRKFAKNINQEIGTIVCAKHALVHAIVLYVSGRTLAGPTARQRWNAAASGRRRAGEPRSARGADPTGFGNCLL